MSKKILCKKLNKELPALEIPPMPGPKGLEIMNSVSEEAWEMWKSHQTTLINEKHLDMSNPENRKWLQEQMDKFFNNEDYESASGFKSLDQQKGQIDSSKFRLPILLKNTKFFDLAIKYVGENSASKIKRLSNIILNHSSEALITFKPDAISWLLNIRGNQLKYTPVVRCFALIHKSKKIFLFFEHDLPQFSKLDHGEIIFTNINKFQSILKMFAGENFLVDYNSTPLFVLSALKKIK